MKQSADVDMTCEQIAIEYKSNTGVADGKIANNRRADKREFWLGILVWPGLMDLQNADGNEGNALLDRNVSYEKSLKTRVAMGGSIHGRCNRSGIHDTPSQVATAKG
jgi:hypothetical protein